MNKNMRGIYFMQYMELFKEVNKFAKDRNFVHPPKDLAIALSIEASELLEHFLWETGTDFSKEKYQEIGYEMADVMIYLMYLSQELNIDLLSVTKEKLEINKERFK